MAFVLGPLLELNLRRSLILSDGSPAIFFTRPIAAGIMLTALMTLSLNFIPMLRKKRPDLEDEVI